MSAARAALAGAGGLLLFAGHPPADVGVLGLVALVPLVVLGRSYSTEAQTRGALWWGFVAGVVFFVPLLSWLLPFGVLPWLLLSALEAVSVALFVWIVAAWGDRRVWGVAAVVAWVALEVARARWPLGGFGWGLLGYTQHDGGPLLPIARVLGVWGVGAVCATVAVALVALGEAALGRRLASAAAAEKGAAPTPWGPAAAGALCVAAVVGAAAVSPPAPTGAMVDIAAVQGNDLQRSSAAGVQRRDEGRIVAVAEAMLAATRPLADDPPDVTVWPENALDDDPRSSAPVGAAVSEALALLDGTSLVVGALVDGPRTGTALNIAAEIVDGPRFEEVYVKRQTVPFAEYIPGRRFLEWFPPLRQIPLDILGADEPVVITAGEVPLGVVICFENIFPGVVADQVDAGAELVVVSTNNASFGNTPMSRQHLAFSQVRAVETGRHVLHAGISGISGIVDPHGSVTQQTQLYQEAIVRDDVPLVAGVTPFLLIRHLLELAALVAGAVVLLVAALGRRRSGTVTDA